MVADIMTKGLSGKQFKKLRLMSGVAPMTKHPETSEKECCERALVSVLFVLIIYSLVYYYH